MSVMSKLERAEQEAEAARQALYADDDAGESDKTDDKSAVADEPGEKTDAAVDAGDAGDEAIPGKAVEADEAKDATTPLKEEDADAVYKQKYAILEGKYKAEVPRLSSELTQWKEYASGLQARVTALEEAAKTKPSEPKPGEPAEEDYEVEAFVADNPGAAKLIEKMKKEHKAELASLRDEIKSLDKKTSDAKSEFKQMSERDKFDARMAVAGVPDWQEIDVDPLFADWLSLSKARELEAAAKSFDSAKVSSIFLEYKRSLDSPDNGSGQDKSDKQDKLDKFVAPPRGGGGSPPSKGGAYPALTRANYDKFMLQTMKGKYKPSQWGGLTESQMEAKFDAAIAKNELL